MHRPTFLPYVALLFAVLFFSCSDDDLLDKTVKLTHDFTLETENTYQYEINGVTYTEGVRVLNSLNNNLYISVDMGFGKAGIILPKQTGTFQSGHDFGPANGTEGNNAFLNVFLTHENEKYYAYSSNPYGYPEDNKIPGSVCHIEIIKYEGDYTDVEIWGLSGYGRYVLFVGAIDVLFAGTFKTADGSKSIEVEKGQIKILSEVNGTTVRYPE